MLNFQYNDNLKDETIIMIHPFGGHARSFKKQLAVFNEFYNTLCIDLNGHGLSKDISLVDKPKNWFFMANEIIKIMNHLNIEKAHFMGASLGTLVISSIAMIYPKRIVSMILIGNATVSLPRFKVLLPLASKARHIFSDELTYKLFAYIMLPGREHRIARGHFVKAAINLGHKEFFAWQELINNFYKEYTYSDLINDIPTLFIMGNTDHTFLKPAEKLSTLHTNSDIVILNAGHLVNLDSPAKVNEISLDFYEANSYSPAKETAICS